MRYPCSMRSLLRKRSSPSKRISHGCCIDKEIWYPTEIAEKIVFGCFALGSEDFHYVVVHQCRGAIQRKATRCAQHTAKTMLGGFLQPVAHRIFHFLGWNRVRFAKRKVHANILPDTRSVGHCQSDGYDCWQLRLSYLSSFDPLTSEPHPVQNRHLHPRIRWTCSPPRIENIRIVKVVSCSFTSSSRRGPRTSL